MDQKQHILILILKSNFFPDLTFSWLKNCNDLDLRQAPGCMVKNPAMHATVTDTWVLGAQKTTVPAPEAVLSAVLLLRIPVVQDQPFLCP